MILQAVFITMGEWDIPGPLSGGYWDVVVGDSRSVVFCIMCMMDV